MNCPYCNRLISFGDVRASKGLCPFCQKRVFDDAESRRNSATGPLAILGCGGDGMSMFLLLVSPFIVGGFIALQALS